MEIPLLRGRDFTIEDEQEHAAKVMIVDEAAARRYWPGQDLIGKSVLPEATVVGVVANTRRDSLREDPGPQVYVPYGQQAFVEPRTVTVDTNLLYPFSLSPAVHPPILCAFELMARD